MMSQNDDTLPNALIIEPQNGLEQMASFGIERTAASVAADRLYQLAALTAGIFLLVTLL
jgi:hypothetical protein